MNSLELTYEWVKSIHQADRTGHDIAHLERVQKLVRMLVKDESVDEELVYLAAWLHDVEDRKLGRPPGLVKRHLESLRLPADRVSRVLTIIEETSFSKGLAPTSRESAILQDADRLDAIGAIGVARTFQYAGASASSMQSALAHFDDKLLRLADAMHTERAKRLATERHTFLLAFKRRFEAEWNGLDIESFIE